MLKYRKFCIGVMQSYLSARRWHDELGLLHKISPIHDVSSQAIEYIIDYTAEWHAKPLRCNHPKSRVNAE